MVIKPEGIEVIIKEIQVNDKPTSHAFPGDICDVMITLKKDKDWQYVQKGCFLSSVKLHVPTTHKFLADIKLYDLKDPILIGSRVNLHLCGHV